MTTKATAAAAKLAAEATEEVNRLWEAYQAAEEVTPDILENFTAATRRAKEAREALFSLLMQNGKVNDG